MRGMILAAGLGTRMGPISRYLAKPAVPYLGVPMIEHSVQVLRSAGIDEIVVNTHHLPHTVEAVLGDGSRLDVAITYSHEDPVLGTGGGIGRVADFFGDETFMVINSDVLIDVDAMEVAEAHRQSGAAATLLLRPDPERRYAGVEVDRDGMVRRIEGLPEGVDSPADAGAEHLMFAGLHVIEPRWFDYAPDQEIYDSIRDVYAPMLAAGERIGAHFYDGSWIDIGSARRLLAASLDRMPAEGIVADPAASAGNDLRHSVVPAAVTLGGGCSIEDSILLGGARLGEGCSLRGCIVCPGAEIDAGAAIRDALVETGLETPLSELQ